jgi:Trypsin-like peptidase domain
MQYLSLSLTDQTIKIGCPTDGSGASTPAIGLELLALESRMGLDAAVATVLEAESASGMRGGWLVPTIDQYTFAAIPVELFFQTTNLGLATGFVWEEGGHFYLITNWHALSGRDVFTKKHTSATAAEPDRVRVWWNAKVPPGNRTTTFESIRDPAGAPLWLVHPHHGNDVDVVALPVTPDANAEMYPINRMSQADLTIRIGMDVYVLGYPYGIGSAGLPTWKRGSIASEPEVFPPGQLYMLIDTAGRPGMSGSPVIRRSWGTHMMRDGRITMGGMLTATAFVGVYSGRLTAVDPLDAQLGIAWPASLVPEIVAGGRIDS